MHPGEPACTRLTWPELESSLNKLSLSSQNQKKTSSTKTEPIADSWEDDDISSGEETDRPIDHTISADYPAAPPPTPISPTTPSNGESFIGPSGETWDSSSSSSPRGDRNNSTRPEKTDAVAKRLIAGALGVRAPKKTEEQRAYDRAVREKEMKRINAEKEAKVRAEEEAARAKAAAWDD
jgi:hypothetical protein